MNLRRPRKDEEARVDALEARVSELEDSEREKLIEDLERRVQVVEQIVGAQKVALEAERRLERAG